MTKLSYQLYSSREFPPLGDTLQLLSSLGYEQVEAFGGLYENLDALSAALRSSGLSMPTGHIGLEMLENDLSGALEVVDAIGMKAIYGPYLAEEDRPKDAAGWRALGERLQKIKEDIGNRDLVFGWHNHDFEFVACEDGSIPMEEMFAGAPDISWEADIAWIVRGGADPFDWISRHGDRISSVHIKDIAPVGECLDEDGWADVGHGTMDWKGLLDALKKTPAQYFVMEHDNPNDHERFASRSIASVKKMMGV